MAAPRVTVARAAILLVLFAREQPELARVALRLGEAEMLERRAGEQSSPRRALEKALLDQIRLYDVLERVARLRQGRGDGVDADRAAAIVERDRREIAPVHGVEAGRVDLQRR